ncbi:hypothetical protein [Alkalihalobacterium elongatum]|uniref:hypothetical protein n=1 Tax=Alkalihalobacterium elongatum TaxID=2675466 RepID=UPI001C1F6EB1|nr:hypothetical protein [Alkalihalobacterium elongatum]
MQINIRNIRINSMSTIGSLNIGKQIFSDNHANTIRLPKPFYEEVEPNNEEEEGENETIDINNLPPITLPPG